MSRVSSLKIHVLLRADWLLFSGGYAEGGSADHRYNLSFIVQNSADAGIPIIAVGINYRLHGTFCTSLLVKMGCSLA